MTDSLKGKTVHGVGWSFADNIASSGISFLVGLVLARILSPSEFGILGLITIFIAISNSFVDSGFSNALIRKKDASEKDYNTVFYFNLIVGLIFYVIIYISAPVISKFFKEPSLISITRVMGGVLLINALSIIQRTLLVKKVDFKTQTKISVIVSLSSGVIGISMALFGFGVWSLVGQQISRQFLNSVFLWKYSSWRPSWIFSKKSFKELFGFGSKIMLSGLITTIHKHIYYLVIGRFYSASQLGQYTRAEQFNSIFSSNLTNVVQRVSFPVLSSIQDEPERLRVAYRKVIRTTMLVTFVCMLGLAAVAKPLVLTLIGEKWLESVYYLQIICFSGMLYPLHALNLNILQVKGRSDLYLKLEIIKKILALIPIFLGIRYGIEYMLWGSVIVSLFAYFLNSYYSANLIDYSTAQQVKDILPAFFISSFIAICMWGISLFDLPNLSLLIMQLITGLVLTIIIYENINNEEYKDIRQIIFSFVRKKK